MKTITDIKHMMREPASKDWFAKHGLPGKKQEIASKMGGKIPKKPVKYLSEAEQKEKTKHWPKGNYKEPSEKDQVAHQKRTGRAYSE